MDLNSKIYIAGHNGMVGSAILRNMRVKGYKNFVFTPFPEYDLTNQQTVESFFEKEKPEYVIDAAAKVGGILANDTYRAQFIYENLMIQNNIIHQAHLGGVSKFIFLGSSCIYPRVCPQPIKEEYILTSALEHTNQPYAIAKIAGIEMCKSYFEQYGSNFISLMPTNLFGPGDNYSLETSHVVPALIRKFHEAKISGQPSVQVWGTGNVKREFLFVDDMADAAVHLLENFDAEELYDAGISHINIGSGMDQSISDLAKIIKNVVGFKGDIAFDFTKPDGTPQKLLDVSRIHKLGWTHKTDLEQGLSATYQHYLMHESQKSL